MPSSDIGRRVCKIAPIINVSSLLSPYCRSVVNPAFARQINSLCARRRVCAQHLFINAHLIFVEEVSDLFARDALLTLEPLVKPSPLQLILFHALAIQEHLAHLLRRALGLRNTLRLFSGAREEAGRAEPANDVEGLRHVHHVTAPSAEARCSASDEASQGPACC